MQNREWKEILDGINFQGLSHENVIERIKEKLLAAGHQDIYRKWEENSFNVNHSFALQREHTNGGCTLLHLAASYGLTDVVNALLKTRAKVNAKDQDDTTPLHLAAKNGHIRVVKVLLKKGANPSFKNEYNQTPISLAQNNNIMQFLKKAKKRQFLHSAILMCMTVNVLVTLEIITTMLNITQENVPTIIMPIILVFTTVMVIILAIIDCFIAHEALSFDTDEPNTGEPNTNEPNTGELNTDEPNTGEPNTETSELQIEEKHNVEVSAV